MSCGRLCRLGSTLLIGVIEAEGKLCVSKKGIPLFEKCFLYIFIHCPSSYSFDETY
jgi:hypothetical protein